MHIKVKFVLLSLLLLGFPKGLAAQSVPISIDPSAVELEGDLGPFRLTRTTRRIQDHLSIVTLTLSAPAAATPKPLTIKLDFPSSDVFSFWNPNLGADRVNYYRNRFVSRVSTHAPVFTLISQAGGNRMTFALSDGLNKIDLRSYLREEDARFYVSAGLFAEPMPPLKTYSVQIRLDTRPIRFHKALNEVASWWAGQAGYQPTPVPEAAKQPMYSTWYSFHQNLVVDEVVEEARLAKGLGFEAIIVDDGWQTLDASRGYAYTGDWEPLRTPDMKGFVKRIHDLEMDFLLWYSLPFIGERAKLFERFQGKYLKYWDGQGAYVLDPRFAEVREYLISTFERAMEEWDLDGFKIDFIDRFTPDESTSFTLDGGRDTASLYGAVDQTMTQLIERLRGTRPDVLIEFRQRYIGPLMRKYGNMFRSVDCPNNAIANRIQTTDLRILSGDTVVHSDMFMWHETEPVQQAALQILNVLYSVPQLSVRLSKIPSDHREMVRFWIQYWKSNRHILLDGEFTPGPPAALYPWLMAENSEKRIVTVFEDMVIRVEDTKRLDVVNASASNSILIDLAKPLGPVRVETFDTRGRTVSVKSITLAEGVHRMAVPRSGLLQITR